MAKSKARAADTTPAARRRRLLHIGPGIVIALILSVIVGYKYVQVKAQMARQSKMPPIVERQLVSSDYGDKSGPTPEIRFILDRKDTLSLNAAQMRNLQALNLKWLRFYQPRMAEASSAADRTESYLSGARKNRRTPVAQIQDQAAPVVAISGEISAARRAYWSQALRILTPEQQKLVQQEREADWTAKMKSMSEKVREAAK